ncbi:MAG: cell division protein FtsQ/DivIB [Albidovulum sp.]
MQPLRAPERRYTSRPARNSDPAPSRMAYRIERLWLTPAFRLAMRVGLPFVLSFAALSGYLASDARRAEIAKTYAELRQSVEERPEFMVRLMAIDGASAPVAEAVRAMLPVTLPASSFKLDLEATRASIAQIDAVASAELHVRKGGILQVTITERQPAMLWRSVRGLEMLDPTGHRVATLLDRAARPDLPVIAGEGADAHVPEALEILAATRPIANRIRGLVFVGERRWDLVLDRGQRVMLPEIDPVPALQRLIALDTAQDMLGRDLTVVDIRNPDRPTVRLGGAGDETLTSLNTKVAAP